MTISICFLISILYFIFLSEYLIYLFIKKKYIIIKNSSKLIKKLEFLQQNPVYNNITSTIINTLNCAYYIENARRNNKPVLIIGKVMCTLELEEKDILNLLSYKSNSIENKCVNQQLERNTHHHH